MENDDDMRPIQKDQESLKFKMFNVGYREGKSVFTEKVLQENFNRRYSEGFVVGTQFGESVAHFLLAGHEEKVNTLLLWYQKNLDRQDFKNIIEGFTNSNDVKEFIDNNCN